MAGFEVTIEAGIRRGVSNLTDIINRRYTREQEREADYLGMYVAHQAGFNIDVAPAAWERFAVATPESMNDSFMNDHPANPERFVRIQKTTEEIRQGRKLQEVWNGDFSETQFAGSTLGNSPAPPVKAVSTASSADSTSKPSAPATTAPPVVKADGTQSPTTPPMVVSSLTSTPTPLPETRPVTKTYASLVQYDGPKIKSGVTLDAQFLDDGSGNGEGTISDIRSLLLKGTFTTINPGAQNWPKPKILDRPSLNNLQILSDRPWVIATFSNADTVLECVYGETRPLGQKKAPVGIITGIDIMLIYCPSFILTW